jgi:hypothetical protein
MIMKFLVRTFFAGFFLLVLITRGFAAESLEQTITYLLHHIETSNVTFIRNGTEHTPSEAGAHIKAKYEHFKGQIKTPEDFIRLSASKSLLTGKPYLVRTPAGKETLLADWLTEALKAHRAQTAQ